MQQQTKEKKAMKKHIYPVRKTEVVLDDDIEHLVFVSDFHACIEPLITMSQLLADDSRKTKIISCGDMLPGGPSPEETVNWVYQNSGNAAVLGNHDEISRALYKNGVNQYKWTQQEERKFGLLSNELQEYLRSLHDEIDLVWRGKRIFVTHGHRTRQEKGVSVRTPPVDILKYFSDDPSVDLTVGGHTHCPFVGRAENGALIANCGSTSMVSFGLREANGEIKSHNPKEPFVPDRKIYSSYVSVTLEKNALHPEIIKFDYDRSVLLKRMREIGGFEEAIALVETGVW